MSSEFTTDSFDVGTGNPTRTRLLSTAAQQWSHQNEPAAASTGGTPPRGNLPMIFAQSSFPRTSTVMRAVSGLDGTIFTLPGMGCTHTAVRARVGHHLDCGFTYFVLH